jgi:GNAT superfamily N-acetyltransferase
MTCLPNPRGRILKVEIEPYLDDHEEHEDLTVSIGLADQKQLTNFLSKVSGDVDTTDESFLGNPLLELWMSNQLVGICSLNLNYSMSSDEEDLEDGEIDELYYSVYFNRIFVDSDLQRLGLGRHLAMAAGAYAGAVIVEDLLKKPFKKVSVMFCADFVSIGGERLFDYLVSETENVTNSAALIAGLEFSYLYEAGF